jgi:hypothetical protein
MEFKREVQASEKNIQLNYKYVDETIIPQLKTLAAEYKVQQKKYKRIKKLLSEYIDTLAKQTYKMKIIEGRIKEQIQSNLGESAGNDMQKYQKYSNNDHHRLTKIQNIHGNECDKHNELIIQVNSIDQKINILQVFKEENELELRHSVDGLKNGIRIVREELKILEREKYSIALKLKSIEDKYNEAKESFKNAEEGLTYTNRLIVSNSRASIDSELGRSSNGRASALHTDSNCRLETDNSIVIIKNTNSRPALDFYTTEPLIKESNEYEADSSSNFLRDR